MRVLLLLSLAVVACSAPASREYARGVLVAPPAPPLRPGHGAPILGQPGSVAPPPRSPHKRDLPRGDAPGIWAGDEPASLAAKNLAHGVPLPYAGEDATLQEKNITEACASAITGDLASFLGAVKSIPPLSVDAKRCIVARLYHQCSKAMEKLYQKNASTLVWMDKDFEAAAKRTANTAEAFKTRACSNIAMSPEAELTYTALSLNMEAGVQNLLKRVER